MGNLKAQVGSDNSGWEEVMGTHGHSVMSENGEVFAKWCAVNELVTVGMLFPHKTINKVPWVLPNRIVANQVDHLAISRKCRTSLLDTRNKRGADINSYHFLMTATLRIKLKKTTEKFCL